jgi:EAL domain-containing protein (putative c-di-GMP-specific phosphodiesterase class I)
LHQLPIDVIKLDRSLIENINHSKYFANLASLVVQLLADTPIRVIAEGIETEKQLVALQQIGCQLGQGYFFARPMKADEVPDFVLAQQSRPSIGTIERSNGVHLGGVKGPLISNGVLLQ